MNRQVYRQRYKHKQLPIRVRQIYREDIKIIGCLSDMYIHRYTERWVDR